MTIPEIRARLMVLAVEHGIPELAELAEATKRRSFGSHQPRRESLTNGKAEQIRAFCLRNPDVDYQTVASLFNVNPGRVSEAIRGKRQ